MIEAVPQYRRDLPSRQAKGWGQGVVLLRLANMSGLPRLRRCSRSEAPLASSVYVAAFGRPSRRFARAGSILGDDHLKGSPQCRSGTSPLLSPSQLCLSRS